MTSFGMTHRGLVRKKNEDHFLIKEFNGDGILMAVADDGMGGHAGAEHAAEMVMQGPETFALEMQQIENLWSNRFKPRTGRFFDQLPRVSKVPESTGVRR